MRARLTRTDEDGASARERSALRAARYRIAGAALVGLVVIAWWAGRSAGAW